MRGRTIFTRLKPVIELTTLALRRSPRSVRESVLALARSMPGLVGVGVRYVALKSLAKRCGDNVFIGQYALLSFVENLEVGSNVSIRESCNIGASGGLVIGNDVSIAHNTSVLTTEHDYRQLDEPMRTAPGIHRATAIEDGAWIGAHCLITAGVTVGRGAVVGGGSVVTKDVPPFAIVAGVPARVLGSRLADSDDA